MYWLATVIYFVALFSLFRALAFARRSQWRVSLRWFFLVIALVAITLAMFAVRHPQLGQEP